MITNVIRKTFRSLITFFILALVFTFDTTSLWAKESPCSFKLTIIYMNDTHGHYSPEKDSNGVLGAGFAKAATVMERIRKACELEGRTTLTLLAGDMFSGTAYSAVFKGKLGVKLMNDMKFSAMSVGNHEFDYGQSNLINNLRPAMKFPLLSANIRYADGNLVFKPYVIEKLPDKKCRILIFGLTTENTPELTHPRNVKGLVFADPVDVAREIVEKHGKDKFVIALTHLGVEKDKKLGLLCPGIDVIIGGHSHTALFEPVKLDDTLVCQAGAYSQYVGRLDVDVKDGRIEYYKGQLIKLDGTIEEDRGIRSTLQKYSSKMAPFFSETIGSSAIALEGSLSAVRSSKPNPLGILVAYVMAKAVNAEAGLINGGAIRDGLKIGPITNGDIYGILPFQNLVTKVALTGSDIESVLRRSLELPERSGGKLQTYGLRHEISGGELQIKEVGSKPFRREDYYSVALTDFLLAGGDGYTTLGAKGKTIVPDGAPLIQIFSDFIKDKKEINQNLLDSLLKR